LSSHLGWFINCAKYLGENKLVMELRKKEDADIANSKAYESENLTSVQQNPKQIKGNK